MKRCSIAFSLLILILAIASNSCKKDDIDNNVKVDEITFNPSVTYGEVVDIDGNKYKTVVIGSKEWMAENLKSTHYNDGSPIPYIKGASEWENAKVEAYSIFDNNSAAYKDVYGALYNFFTIADERNICPIGWHVPSYKELNEFISEIGGDFGSGLKLKEAGSLHWEGLNNSNNSTGFTAIPAGARKSNGIFNGVGVESDWWTSTEVNVAQGIAYFFANPANVIQLGIGSKNIGASVRCVKDDAVLKTLIVSDIEQTSATCGGRIVSENAISTVERGVCWSTERNPTVSNEKSSNGTGVGIYSCSLTGLKIATTYYVRAFVNTGADIIYGDEVSFTTLSEGMATINTISLGNITPISIESGGCILKDGGNPITSRGVCWSTSPNPTIDLTTKTIDGSGIGSFVSSITGLSENNTYYIRAYATNSKATTYGNEISVSLGNFMLPKVVTNFIKDVYPESVTCRGNVIGNGGLDIISRGVCWSTTQNPTIETSNSTNDGVEEGIFESKATGLSESTYYYIRTYAKNSYGVAYGDQISFTTPRYFVPNLNVWINNISFTSAILNAKISQDGYLDIIEKGFCWSLSPNPTIESGNKILCGTGRDEFSYNITGLDEGVRYYVRSYAINSKGIAYSSEDVFTTLIHTVPTINYTSIYRISLTSAVCDVYIQSDGGAPLVEKGICWSLSPNPTIENSNKIISSSSSNSEFECKLSGLTEDTKYYVKAYAINSFGIAYGQEEVFTTLKVTVPILTSIDNENICYRTADCNVYINSDGNSPLTERGICWSTSPNPSIENGNKIVGETKMYWAKFNISGLEPNTTYYVKGYAINGKGVGYSSESSFKTLGLTVPKLTTLNASFVTPTTLTIGGNITDDGGDAILDKGMCWSTSPNPTIELSDKISLGTGTTNFSGKITGLTENTKYYFRSYAINSLGISYGNEVQVLIYFGTVTDVDGNVYNTLAIGTQIWMKENLKTTKYSKGEPIQYIVRNDEWSAQTNGAYGWYNNDINNKDLYGALYNGYSVMDNRKLCPIGWHMPTEIEWNKLMNYLGGYEVAGGKMKATTLWDSPNTGADNSSGFNAFAGGERVDYNGTFRYLGKFSEFWSFNNYQPYWLSCYKISLDAANLWHSGYETKGGISVRCLKDE